MTIKIKIKIICLLKSYLKFYILSIDSLFLLFFVIPFYFHYLLLLIKNLKKHIIYWFFYYLLKKVLFIKNHYSFIIPFYFQYHYFFSLSPPVLFISSFHQDFLIPCHQFDWREVTRWLLWWRHNNAHYSLDNIVFFYVSWYQRLLSLL